MMDKFIEWMVKHKKAIAIFALLLFFGPLLVVHVLYKIQAGLYWLESDWNSGDVLAYISGFESLLGSLILGSVAIYQNKQAQRTNEELQILQQAQFVSMVSAPKVTLAKQTSSIPNYLNNEMQKPVIVDLTADNFSSVQSYHIDVQFKNDSDYPIVQLTVRPGERADGNCQLYKLKNFVEIATYIPKNGTRNYRFIVPCKVFEELGKYAITIRIDFVNIFDYITPSILYIPDLQNKNKKNEFQYCLSKFTDVKPR